MGRVFILGRNSIVFIGVCLSFALPVVAWAKTYPPTQAGLRQLVADDAAMLPAPYAARLQKNETAWEKQTNAMCVHTQVPSLCYSPLNIMAEIQSQIGKVDGFVIDSSSWSASLPASEQSIETGGSPDQPITMSKTFPVVVFPDTPKAAKLNSEIGHFEDRIWSWRLGGPHRSDLRKYSGDNDIAMGYSLNADSISGVVSMQFSWSDFQHGAFEAQTGGENFNWIEAQARPLAASDIFEPATAWKYLLAELVLAKIMPLPEAALEGLAIDGLVNVVSDPSCWVVTKAGLELDIDLTGNPAGFHPVLIKWSWLKPVLNKNGLVAP